jgi:hypothetical protein
MLLQQKLICWGAIGLEIPPGDDSISHLFFDFPTAKFVWSVVGQVIEAPSRPGSFTPFFWWFPQFLPFS